jgi:hypothetical protein
VGEQLSAVGLGLAHRRASGDARRGGGAGHARPVTLEPRLEVGVDARVETG